MKVAKGSCLRYHWIADRASASAGLASPAPINSEHASAILTADFVVQSFVQSNAHIEFSPLWLAEDCSPGSRSTDEFGRASRGEVNIVVGRKGAGKTALFSQLQNEKRSNSQTIVVDLKPEGYQLIRLKEDVLDYLAEGAKTHVITAFFEYVLYLEISYKVLEKDKDRHVRDGRLYEPYRRLLDVYQSGDAGEGDYSERLLSLSRDLVIKFRETFGTATEQRLTPQQVTELIYKHNIREIRDALSAYLKFKNAIWVLFASLYNPKRRHSTIGYLSPMEFERQNGLA